MNNKDLGAQVNLTKQDNLAKPNYLYTRLLKLIKEETRKIGKENPKYFLFAIVSLERFNVKKQKPIRTKHYNAIAKVVAMKVSLIEVKKYKN